MCLVRISSAYSLSYSWQKLLLVHICCSRLLCSLESWLFWVSDVPTMFVHLPVTSSNPAVTLHDVVHRLQQPLASWRSLQQLQLFTGWAP